MMKAIGWALILGSILGFALILCSSSHGQAVNATRVNFNGQCPAGTPPVGTIWTCQDVTGAFACIKSDGSSCLASSAAFSTLLGGTNTAAAMVSGSGSSLVPGGSGELASNVSWLNPGGAGLFAPPVTPTFSQTGGSLSSASGFHVQVTLCNSFGESLPSFEVAGTVGGGCTSGSTCPATITAPTLLAGQTYTVYTGNSPGGEKKQAAANNCVNITGNCIVQSIGAGAIPPTTNTTIPVSPSPLGSTSSCAPWNTSGYVLDPSGNFQSAWAVDTTSTYVGVGKGNLTFCRPVIFNITGVKPNFVPNGAYTIFHIPSNTTTTVAAQTQLNEPTTDTGTYAGQWLGNYTEVDLFGAPTLQGGSIYGQQNAAAGRFVMAHKTSGANNTGAVAALSATIFRESGTTDATNCGATECYISMDSTAINLNNATSSFRGYVAYRGEVNTVSASDAGGHGIVFEAMAPTTNGARLGSANYAFYSQDFGSTIGDWASFHLSNTTGTSSRHYFGGPVDLNGGILGSVGVTQLTTPGGTPQVTVTCVATCTANYSYKVVPADA